MGQGVCIQEPHRTFQNRSQVRGDVGMMRRVNAAQDSVTCKLTRKPQCCIRPSGSVWRPALVLSSNAMVPAVGFMFGFRRYVQSIGIRVRVRVT